ncbi:FAD-binding protein [Elioraea tepida]|jgi:glycolate oxidase FAD binding subunit|uniref:FAD-binding protein n=1 Tax=Elioraea tepida TaxID=2843330 RepID=A0A975U2L4_9PROT|nr:FAD-binding protein [Elioraea tepida]QXM24484.1 FAD-binding protein [Elioraea tepida]
MPPGGAASALEAPADEAALVARIAAAHAAGEPLAIWGNRTKASLGRPVQTAAAISTRALSGITLYSPSELVIAARAGTPVAELEAALSAEGQHLVAEPPDLSALCGPEDGPPDGPPTIGGVVACNLSGPRRIALGAMRDHVLGVRAVNGAGEVITSGGRVLKNVTGLDLCKLLSGSRGTLAVLTEVTLKVLPAPEATATLVLRGLTAEEGVVALAAGLGSPFGVTGAAFLPDEAAEAAPALGPGGSATILRLEEFAEFIPYRAERLSALLATHGVVRCLDDATSRVLWRSVRDAAPLCVSAAEGVWRLSVRPSSGPRILASLKSWGLRCLLDWGGGLVWATGPATESSHIAVSAAAAAAGGAFWTVRAPPSLRAALPVVPPESPSVAALTRRVKAAFDPKGILSPGRIFAGI